MASRVMITGASSGIGWALAREMAARGHHLALTARRLDKLEALRALIGQDHPRVKVAVQALDVTRDEQVGPVMADLADALGGLETVVVNAGIGLGEKIGDGRFVNCRRMIATNLLGAVATVDAAVPYLQTHGRGHIVGISSILAFRGLPRSAVYSATKSALANYLLAIRPYVRRQGTDVTILYPGFIDTPLNEMRPYRPFVISAEKASRLMADKMARRVRSAMIPAWPWSLVKWVMRLVPDRLIAGM